MNHTQNYQLNQWEPGDKVQRADFNADNAKIDETLKDHADQLALKGNCNYHFMFRKGTGEFGESHPTQVKIEKQPKFAIIIDSETGKFLMHSYYSEIALSPWYPDSPITMKEVHNRESDGTRNFYLRWYGDSAEHQFNLYGHGYCVIVFYTT